MKASCRHLVGALPASSGGALAVDKIAIIVGGVSAAKIILAARAPVVKFPVTLVENRLVTWRPAPFNAHA